MGLITLHNCTISWLLNFLKLKLDFQVVLLFQSLLVITVYRIKEENMLFTLEAKLWGLALNYKTRCEN